MRPMQHRAALVGFIVFFYLISSVCGDIFEPYASSTFDRTEERIAVHYSGDDTLRAFVGIDRIQIGKFFSRLKFGCVQHIIKGLSYQKTDGIMGFAPNKNTLPRTIAFALTDKEEDSDSAYTTGNQVFAVFFGHTSGELQLGGFDTASVLGPVVYTPMEKRCDNDGDCQVRSYSVQVTSLKIAGMEILPLSGNTESVSALVDSGTTCLMIPSHTMGGAFTDSPFHRFWRIWSQISDSSPSIFITIGGKSFEISSEAFANYDKLNIQIWQSACVEQTMPGERFPIVLGTPFFRSVVVVHDFEHESGPRLGFGVPHPLYQQAFLPSSLNRHLLSANASESQWWSQRRLLSPDKSNVFLQRLGEYGLYTVPVQMGTPPQTLDVVLDTGSSVFGVFTDYSPLSRETWIVAFFPATLLAIIFLMFGAYWYCKQRYSRRKYSRVPLAPKAAV